MSAPLQQRQTMSALIASGGCQGCLFSGRRMLRTPDGPSQAQAQEQAQVCFHSETGIRDMGLLPV